MRQEAARKTVSKEELEEKALVSLAKVRESSFAVSKLMQNLLLLLTVFELFHSTYIT